MNLQCWEFSQQEQFPYITVIFEFQLYICLKETQCKHKLKDCERFTKEITFSPFKAISWEGRRKKECIFVGWCIPSFHPYSLWNCSSFPGVAQKHTIIHLCSSGVWEENEPCWCQHPIKQHILQAQHCTFTSLPSWAFRREWTQNKCHQSCPKCSKRLNINSLLLMLWISWTLGIYMYILLPFFSS